MIYYGVKPRPLPKIRISQFETPTVMANSLLLRLRLEIQKSPLLFIGLQPDYPEHLEIWKQFLHQNQEAGMKYTLVVADQNIKDIDTLAPQEKLATLEQSGVLFEGVENALAAGNRVAVIVPSVYSAQMIHGNLVNLYKQKTGKEPMSLSLMDFPRKREDEKQASIPCNVEGVDQTGTGPFGCMVIQTARANYRKRFEPGKFVGLVNQIGLNDYLILYSIEK